jgi:DNA-binding winged helix-turn-helix (wHTH) protein
MIYRFGGCLLDVSKQELTRDDEPVAVEPQVFAVLEYLATNADRVVTKIELLDEVWGDRFVSESALTSRIKLARQACGDSGRSQQIIRTVHGRGYRMIAPITELGRARGATRGVTQVARTGSRAVGREQQAERVLAAATEAATGTRRTIFVTGPTGGGKSALVADVLEQIDDLERWSVVAGRCHRARSGPEPYYALLEGLGSLAAAEPDLVRDSLDRVAPSWLLQLPALVDDDAADRLERRLMGAGRQRMLREGVDAFTELARRRPTILVVEDLQHADACTLDVLELLARRNDPAPLLLVATTRPGRSEVDEVIADVTSSAGVEHLQLEPLDRATVARLAAERHPDVSIAPDLVDILHDRCDGNPLFANEILAVWETDGLLREEDGVLGPGVDEQILAATVPPGLVPLIERTLGALAPDEVALLEAAAATGNTFDAAAVAAAVDRPVAEIDSLLARMAREPDHIDAVGAVSWPDGTVSTRYRFVHQLHRDVIYDRTVPSRRAMLHSRIGRALEAGHEGSLFEIASTLADHFLAADDAARSARYLRRAAAQALSREAHGGAEDLLRAALEQCDRLEPGPERDEIELEIRLLLGQARVGAHGWFDGQVAEHYENALDLAAALGAADEEAHARYALATISEMHGQFERTEELLGPMVAGDTSELGMEAHELVACSTFHQGAFGRSQSNADAVLSTTPDDTPSKLMAAVAEHPATSCNSWMSLTNWFLGRSDDSLKRAENAVRLGERHRYALAVALQQRAMLHQLRDEPEECRRWAERAIALERPLISRFRRLQVEVLRDWARSFADAADDVNDAGVDATDDVVRSMADTLRDLDDAGVQLDMPYFLALQADVLLRQGAPADALSVLDDAEARIDASTRSYFHRPEMYRLRARAHLLLGDGDERAAEELAHAAELAAAMGSPVMMLRIVCDQLELERGAATEARREQVSALVDLYDGQSAPPDVVRAQRLLTT